MLDTPWEYTKIVATIGPASDEIEKLEKLLVAGMNVARLNTKHGTTEWHAERIDRIRTASKNTGKPVGILLDLQGPEIRVDLPEKKSFPATEGEHIVFCSTRRDDQTKQVIIPENVVKNLEVGNEVSLEDGVCEFKIVEKHEDYIVAEAQGNFTVADRKTMNTPGVVIDMPSLIPTDMEKLDALHQHPVDFIALSFVRNKSDIQILREEMAKRHIEASVVAKIENQSAIDHLEEIIEVSDAVMVARGDLAVEIPMEELSFWQKEIIRKCRTYGKPVITATQMLKSMVESPRPTRAEVSDVSNAVFDGTDAVMLSEETTIGKYPVKTVKTMRKIVQFNESHTTLKEYEKGQKSRTMAVTKMAVHLLNDHIEHIDKALVLTETGFTAQQLTRHRPHVPVLAVTDSQQTANRMNLFFGVYPVFQNFPEGKIQEIQSVVGELHKKGYVSSGDQLLVVHGTNFKHPGQTNTVSVIEVE